MTQQSLRRPVLPDPPVDYDQQDQARTRRYLEQFALAVQTRISAIEQDIEDLDARITALE